MSQESIQEDTGSKEKLLIVMMIALGISVLFPWNTVLKMIPYLRVKLSGTHYEGNFANYLTTCFSASNVIAMSLLVLGRLDEYLIHSNQVRILLSLSINVFLLGIAALGPFTDMFGWKVLPAEKYFYLLVIDVILIGISNALLQKGIYGLTARFPLGYTPLMLSGQGMAGFLSTIFSFGLAKGTPIMAFLFFWVAMMTILIGLILFLVAEKKSPGFSQYANGDEEEGRISWASMKASLSNIRFYAVSMLIIMALTLSLYPSVVSSIYPSAWDPNSNNGKLQSRYDKLFLQICYLVFDIGDVLGKSLPSVNFFKFGPSHMVTRFIAYLRLLYLPVFFSCHIVMPRSDGYREGGPWGWLVRSDILFFIIHFSFAVTNGYGNSLLMMAAPSVIQELNEEGDKQNNGNESDDQRKGMAGSIMGLFINLGLAIGSLLSFGSRAILCRCNPFSS